MNPGDIRIFSQQERGPQRVEVFLDPHGKPVRFRIDLARGIAVGEVFHDFAWREVHTLLPPLASMQTTMEELFTTMGHILSWPE